MTFGERVQIRDHYTLEEIHFYTTHAHRSLSRNQVEIATGSPKSGTCSMLAIFVNINSVDDRYRADCKLVRFMSKRAANVDAN